MGVASHLEIDESNLRVSGASVADSKPPPSSEQVAEALSRTEGWLRRHAIDPYGGTGIDSLRLFALEVQCWDRLWLAEDHPERKRLLAGEVKSRLRRFVDPAQMVEDLRSQADLRGALEILILSSRSRAHDVNITSLTPILETLAPPLNSELDLMPPATAALFVAHLADLDLETARPLDYFRRTGALATKPREVKMKLSDVYGLTQEILAYTGLAQMPLDNLSDDERIYLHRVLPHLAMTYTLLQNIELSADLLSCLALTGMTETYGYREGMRILMTRQNADGSFGAESSGEGRTAKLAATTSCLTALSLAQMFDEEIR